MWYPIMKTAVKLALGAGTVRSYGQFGEDAVIQRLLKRASARTYVDVGAYHPIQYSNTYGLYRQGWRGLAIDPNPHMQSLYRVFRPSDRFVCAAIGTGAATQRYFMFEDGAYNTLDADTAHGIQARGTPKLTSTIDIPVRPLSELVREQGLTKIGFLNVDAEGYDLEILRSHSWDIRPYLVAVEDHGFDSTAPETSQTYRYLRDREYALVAFAGKTAIYRDATS